MARIRVVEIDDFRGIYSLRWVPSPGVNCLIGPGDSGKSTILDAIDLCLGARRTVTFTDADFRHLNIEMPIEISVTIGDLDDQLNTLESYGLSLRGFDPRTGTIEEEPEKELENVLTVRLTVASDLEPAWSLVSDGARAQGQT
jgi:putative ATP-dependent endonuclease of the OLD family